MRILQKLTASFILPVIFCCAPAWAKQLNVIATIPDLAAIVREVGGDRVKVESLASPVQDAHFVDAKPSLILKLMNADLFIETGMEFEVGWAPLLVQNSGNPGIQLNAKGHLDASRAITPLEVPQNPTRALGDVHPAGNPHYLIDPENGKLVARLIVEKLDELSPQDADYFQQNLSGFESRVNENLKRWESEMAPYKGTKVVSYHKDVIYFTARFGLVVVGEIEPKAGIPPTAKHTAEIINRMQADKVKIILTQPWYESRTSESISKATGAKVVTMAMYPGSIKEAKSYIDNIDYNVQSVLKALSQ